MPRGHPLPPLSLPPPPLSQLQGGACRAALAEGLNVTTLSIEGWYRSSTGEAAVPLDPIRFHISEACHRELEAAEEALRKTHEPERFVEVSPRELRLQTPPECGPLAGCKLRVYLGGMDNERGQFHLVGHRLQDGSLVYTKPVMVDLLLS